MPAPMSPRLASNPGLHCMSGCSRRGLLDPRPSCRSPVWRIAVYSAAERLEGSFAVIPWHAHQQAVLTAESWMEGHAAVVLPLLGCLSGCSAKPQRLRYKTQRKLRGIKMHSLRKQGCVVAMEVTEPYFMRIGPATASADRFRHHFGTLRVHHRIRLAPVATQRQRTSYTHPA